MPSDAHPERADVELRLPAVGAYASVLRMTTAGLAARLDFTIEEIEDLRIAIAEASSLVLENADPHGDLVCRYRLVPGRMEVEVETQAVDDPEPDYDSFAWQVLDTLATEAEAGSSGGVFRVRFSMSSQVAPTEAGTGL